MLGDVVTLEKRTHRGVTVIMLPLNPSSAFSKRELGWRRSNLWGEGSASDGNTAPTGVQFSSPMGGMSAKARRSPRRPGGA